MAVVARHPHLLSEVAEDVLRARKLSPPTEPPDDSVMVGSCPAMMAVYDRIRRYSLVNAPVLVGGESGTGKELAAKAIHERSTFRNGPFIAVNCGGMPESLVASELFGYERGAFTGATERRIGRIEAAYGGTLFLDEIGDMPLGVQPQLLRFLQEMAFRRVGGKDLVTGNLRIIAATNVDLDQAVREGRFRKDLYFRLNVLNLELPPLRDRGDDIVILVNYLLRAIGGELGVEDAGVSAAAIGMLQAYHWPGNIRQLTSSIRRALIMRDDGTLDISDFAFIRDEGSPGMAPESVSALAVPNGRHSRKPPLDVLHRVLGDNEQNISKTARYFGVSRVTIYKWLKTPAK